MELVSSIQTCIPHGHLHTVTYTSDRIDTADSPDDEHFVARNMYRIGINKYKKNNCVSSWLCTKTATRRAVNKTLENPRTVFAVAVSNVVSAHKFRTLSFINSFVFRDNFTSLHRASRCALHWDAVDAC